MQGLQKPPPLTLTTAAATRVKALIKAEGNDNLKLRLTISGGGCSGFQYGFDLDEKIEASDIQIEKEGVTLLVDDTSLLYVLGAEVDYIEDLMGAYFKVSNPNATASCGCGTSFSV